MLRFTDAIRMGVVPALVADGLTLPFENLIDWTHAAVWIEEAVARNATKHPDPTAYLQSFFPSGSVVEQMRENVNKIGETVMRDERSIVTSLLLAAAEFAKNRQVPFELWTTLIPLSRAHTISRSLSPSHLRSQLAPAPTHLRHPPHTRASPWSSRPTLSHITPAAIIAAHPSTSSSHSPRLVVAGGSVRVEWRLDEVTGRSQDPRSHYSHTQPRTRGYFQAPIFCSGRSFGRCSVA